MMNKKLFLWTMLLTLMIAPVNAREKKDAANAEFRRILSLNDGLHYGLSALQATTHFVLSDNKKDRVFSALKAGFYFIKARRAHATYNNMQKIKSNESDLLIGKEAAQEVLSTQFLSYSTYAAAHLVPYAHNITPTGTTNFLCNKDYQAHKVDITPFLHPLVDFVTWFIAKKETRELTPEEQKHCAELARKRLMEENIPAEYLGLIASGLKTVYSTIKPPFNTPSLVNTIAASTAINLTSKKIEKLSPNSDAEEMGLKPA